MDHQKPGVMIYFDTAPALELMKDAERGKMFSAILEYGQYGTQPKFTGNLEIVWAMIKPRIDADNGRYIIAKQKNRYATYIREAKKRDEVPLSFAEWVASVDIVRYPALSNDIQLQHNYNSDSTTATDSATEPTIERGADKPPPAPRREYGENGWVKLTDAQHEKLLDDLGAAELERIIRYLDEYAQMNGNKNRWKDWNAVIRKAARERWGMNRERQDAKNRPHTEADYRTGGDFFDESE